VKYSLGDEIFVLLLQEALVMWEKCWKGYECVILNVSNILVE
jgi:hypothetical protein